MRVLGRVREGERRKEVDREGRREQWKGREIGRGG